MADWLAALHQLVFGELFGPEDLAGYSHRAILFGHALWIVAYALIAIRSHRDQLIGIPIIALLLNFTWEWLVLTDCFALKVPDLGFCPEQLGGEYILAIALTLALDVVLLIQAVLLLGARFGFVRSVLLLAGGLVVAFIAHAVFVPTTEDYGALVDSWIINLIMSLLFIALVYQRKDGKGLSFMAGWMKFLGSASVAVGLWVFTAGHPMLGVRDDIVFILAFGVAAADIAYLVVLARRQPRSELTA